MHKLASLNTHSPIMKKKNCFQLNIQHEAVFHRLTVVYMQTYCYIKFFTDVKQIKKNETIHSLVFVWIIKNSGILIQNLY